MGLSAMEDPTGHNEQWPKPTETITIAPVLDFLKDGVTPITLLAVSAADSHALPASLIAFMCNEFNDELDRGLTYPLVDSFTAEGFHHYWFDKFACLMVRGHFASLDEFVKAYTTNTTTTTEPEWQNIFLGTFYVKPNYPGRSSHICNAGFLTSHVVRNQGVGKLLARTYGTWAPKLGYKASVFNLVYENNVASCRLWDFLGYERAGRIKKAGRLRGLDEMVDAIVYYKEFDQE